MHDSDSVPVAGPAPATHAAWVAALSEVQALPWARDEKGHWGDFISLPSIYAGASPVLARHGFALTADFRWVGDLPVVTVVVHHETGPYTQAEYHGPRTAPTARTSPMREVMYAWGHMRTYMLRYALYTFLGIAAGEDPEKARIKEPAQAQAPAPVARPAPAPRLAGGMPMLSETKAAPPLDGAGTTRQAELQAAKQALWRRLQALGVQEADAAATVQMLAQAKDLRMTNPADVSELAATVSAADLETPAAWVERVVYPHLEAHNVSPRHYATVLETVCRDRGLEFPPVTPAAQGDLLFALDPGAIALAVPEAADDRYAEVDF